MRYALVFAIFVFMFSGAALADPYGTVVHKDGSMVAIYRSKSANQSYAAKFTKNGKFGGCVRESLSAYQLRKAYMKASSKWKVGYVPRKFPCLP